MTVSGGARVAINGDGGDYPGFSLGGLATGNGSMLVTGKASEVIIANGGGGNGGGPGSIAIGSAGAGSPTVTAGALAEHAAGGYRTAEHTPEAQSPMRLSYGGSGSKKEL